MNMESLLQIAQEAGEKLEEIQVMIHDVQSHSMGHALEIASRSYRWLLWHIETCKTELKKNGKISRSNFAHLNTLMKHVDL